MILRVCNGRETIFIVTLSVAPAKGLALKLVTILLFQDNSGSEASADESDNEDKNTSSVNRTSRFDKTASGSPVRDQRSPSPVEVLSEQEKQARMVSSSAWRGARQVAF